MGTAPRRNGIFSIRRLPISGCRAHDRPLLGRQRARLEQDGVGDADLADVVQQHAVGEVAQVLLRHAVLAGGGQRVAVHAARVGLGADVARVEGGAQRLQRRPVRLLQLAIGAARWWVASSTRRSSIAWYWRRSIRSWRRSSARSAAMSSSSTLTGFMMKS